MINHKTLIEAFKELDPSKKLKLKKLLFSALGYEPHFKQQYIHYPEEVFGHDWTYLVANWGRRSGKTLAAAMEAIFQLLIPKSRTWVVAPTYALTEKVFREIFELMVRDEVLGPASKILETSNINVRGGNMMIRTKWGSWVEGKTAENPNSLVGEGLDFVILDEAAKINPRVWEQYLEPTLLDRKGRALMISTPEGHNWFYEKHLLGQSDNHSDWAYIHMKSEENPYLDVSWIQDKREEVTEEIFRQEYEASFEHHTGLIYKEFIDQPSPVGHLFDDKSSHIQEWWSHFRAIDPGSNNPTACLWFAVDEKDNVYVYDEYEGEHLLTEVHANIIRAKTKYPIELTYIDPSAETRSPSDGKSVKKSYSEAGIYTTAAHNDVEYGTQAVSRYFRATLQDAPNHPKLFIHKNCIKLRNCLKQYVWDDWSTVSEKNKPEKPRKYKDHLADCLRYFLASKPEHMTKYKKVQEVQPRRRPALPGRPTTGL